MKKLIFLLLLLTSCEKEECWHCKDTMMLEWGVIIEQTSLFTWNIAPKGHDTTVYYIQICDRSEKWILDYMHENSYQKIFERNGYLYIEEHKVHCQKLTCW